MALRALQGPTGGGAPVGGTGTTNTIPRWTGPSTLGDSIITQSGTNRIGVTGAIWCDVAGGVGGVAFGMTDSASIRQTGTNAIMYFDASTTGGNGQFVWRNGNSLTERARIDSAGNFGLGVSIPANAATSNGFYLKNNGNLSFLGPVSYFDVNSYYGAAADRYAVNGFATRYAQVNGVHAWYTAASGTGGNAISFSEVARIDSNGNIYGTSGTTGMTNGFFYIPAAAGAPTGTPTAVSGRVPMYYDTTNNEFYVYNGAWKKVALA